MPSLVVIGPQIKEKQRGHNVHGKKLKENNCHDTVI